MYTSFVLDHGFVTLRNISGPTRRECAIFDADDIDPANTARMSFGQSDTDRPRSQDLQLSDYLLRNWHTTPFEMIEVWLEMKLPIFTERQFARHRTQAINEISGRYVTLPAEWYIPEIVGGKAADKKQGQSADLDPDCQEWFKETLNENCRKSYADYLFAIQEGVAPEHARLLLHLNHYTHLIRKMNLHNLMHFLRLRNHSHAQIEAQIYAQAVIDLIRPHLPHSMVLFDKYRAEHSKEI